MSTMSDHWLGSTPDAETFDLRVPLASISLFLLPSLVVRRALTHVGSPLLFLSLSLSLFLFLFFFTITATSNDGSTSSSSSSDSPSPTPPRPQKRELLLPPPAKGSSKTKSNNPTDETGLVRLILHNDSAGCTQCPGPDVRLHPADLARPRRNTPVEEAVAVVTMIAFFG